MSTASMKPAPRCCIRSSRDDFPQLMWANNYYRFAAFTMFTLFFGGKTYAPNLMRDGLNIQDYLQEHYVNAYAYVARRIGHLPNVVGFGTMNEPHFGLIGVPDLRTSRSSALSSSA